MRSIYENILVSCLFKHTSIHKASSELNNKSVLNIDASVSRKSSRLCTAAPFFIFFFYDVFHFEYRHTLDVRNRSSRPRERRCIQGRPVHVKKLHRNDRSKSRVSAEPRGRAHSPDGHVAIPGYRCKSALKLTQGCPDPYPPGGVAIDAPRHCKGEMKTNEMKKYLL